VSTPGKRQKGEDKGRDKGNSKVVENAKRKMCTQLATEGKERYRVRRGTQSSFGKGYEEGLSLQI